MLLVLAMAGCGGNEIVRCGLNWFHDYFPMDGSWQALYYRGGAAATDTAAAEYDLRVTLLEPAETLDGSDVATWQYAKEPTGELLAQVKWASDFDGIRIVAYAEGAGEFTTFESPIRLSPTRPSGEEDCIHLGDQVTTETDGATWTGTLVEYADVEVSWGLTWEGALHFHLDDDDDSSAPFFTGDYWLVTRYGPGWMRLGDNDEIWDLADYSWEPAE